jgi:hypothetical protein
MVVERVSDEVVHRNVVVVLVRHFFSYRIPDDLWDGRNPLILVYSRDNLEPVIASEEGGLVDVVRELVISSAREYLENVLLALVIVIVAVLDHALTWNFLVENDKSHQHIVIVETWVVAMLILEVHFPSEVVQCQLKPVELVQHTVVSFVPSQQPNVPAAVHQVYSSSYHKQDSPLYSLATGVSEQQDYSDLTMDVYSYLYLDAEWIDCHTSAD